jgi:hypothetical protein
LVQSQSRLQNGLNSRENKRVEAKLPQPVFVPPHLGSYPQT